MNTGKTLFAQIMDAVPWTSFGESSIGILATLVCVA